MSDTDEAAFDDREYRAAADAAYAELLERVGEAQPAPRLDATRRAVELLGDPHRAAPVIHLTGTNGKTSTSRLIEAILRSYGLRTGLMTSPHLLRVNERIVIDGRPISNRAFAENWADITPYLRMTDDELTERGEPRLTFFEALTVLAFASFADAPVDVVVLEVGMGGEWDSTNVADADVAVFTPIALDHTARLGNTLAEIARTKSGIIKPSSSVVSAEQDPSALAEIARAAELTESSLVVQGVDFAAEQTQPGVGGQIITVQGIAGRYEQLVLPLFGEHQAQNAAVAVAAVEAFLGAGGQSLAPDVLADGLAAATSPGRLQLIGTSPAVLVDAAHNPHGAEALARSVRENFDFDELALVVAILDDKDADGIMAALAPIASRVLVTRSTSERAREVADLADIVRAAAPGLEVSEYPAAAEALAEAREWAGTSEKRGVLVTGSITLVGDALQLSLAGEWSA